MPEIFDYEAFAKNLKEQCKDLVPEEFCNEDKKFIIDIVGRFSLLAGEALCNDDTLDFDVQTKEYITQIVAEWTYHKSCDLIRGGIAKQYRESVLQKMAFAVFEVAKRAYEQGCSLDMVVNVVEHHVNKTYKECLENLCEQKAISPEQKEKALSFSNIDDFVAAKTAQTEGANVLSARNNWALMSGDCADDKPSNIKIPGQSLSEIQGKIQGALVDFFSNFFVQAGILLIIIVGALMCLKPPESMLILLSGITLAAGIVLAVLLQAFNLFLGKQNKFYEKINENAGMICLFAAFVLLNTAVYAILAGKTIINPFWLHITATLCLGIFASYVLAKLESEKLHDELEQVTDNMRELINPDKMYERLGVDMLSLEIGEGLLCIADPDQEGKLLAKTAALRQRLTDELGYIIPNIRIRDYSKLDDNEYQISIRNCVVASGFVYPGRYMVLAGEWDSLKLPVPENAIVSAEPDSGCRCYWLEEADVRDLKTVKAVKAEEVIITHLENLVIANVDSLLTTADILKYSSLVESEVLTLSYKLRLEPETVRKIFVNLVEERVSVKDVSLIFDRLSDFSRISVLPDELSERLREVFARNICFQNCEKDKVLYAVTLSDELEKTLSRNVEETVYGRRLRENSCLTPDFVESVARALFRAHEECAQKPVLLCDSKLRLPLYRFLKAHIPTITVLSYNEIVPDVKLETVATVE